MKYIISVLVFALSGGALAATCEENLANTLTYLQPSMASIVSGAPTCTHTFYSVVTEFANGNPNVQHRADRMCSGWHSPSTFPVLEYYLCDTQSSLAKKKSYSLQRPHLQCGSIVQAESQVIGESIPLVGVNFGLNYFSSWSYGRTGNFQVDVQLSGPSIRSDISSFDISIKNGTNTLQNVTIPNTSTNYTHTYTWNGLDSVGMPVLGSFIANVVVKEHRPSTIVPIHTSVVLGGFQAAVLGLGGWLPSNYVFYDVVGKRLFKGNGAQEILVGAKTLSSGELMVVEADGSLVYFHDSSGRHLRTKLGLTGAVIEEFAYDSAGRLISISQPFSKVTNFNRDSLGRLISITSPNGIVTNIDLDTNGYISNVTDADGKEYVITYSGSQGLIYQFQKPGGDVSTFNFDAYGNLTKDSHSGGYFFDLARNLSGSLTHDIKSTSAMGRKTGIKTIVQGGGLNRTVDYPSSMQDKYIINDFPSSGQINLQTTTRSVGTSDYSANDPRFSNLAKRPISKALQLGGQWRQINYSYNVVLADAADPFSISTYTVNQVVAGKNTKLTSAFNPATKTFTHTTFLGRTATQVIDSYQRLVSSKVGNETPVEYTYTNEKLTQVNQGVRSATFTYNTSGFLSSVQPSSGATIYYGYDPAGRIISQSRDGAITNIAYDLNGNVTSIQPFLKPTHLFSYNAHGLPSQYDPPTLLGVSPVATSFTYNLDKQLTQVTRPDGDNITFNYNAVSGLLTSYTTPAGSFSVSMNTAVNAPASVTTPSGGIATSFSYYGDRVSKTSLSKVGLGSIGAYEAKFASGTHLQNSEIITAGSTNFTTNYSYTDDEQLATAGVMSYSYSPLEGYLTTGSLTDGGGTITDSYTYNSFGEIVTYGAWHGSNLLYSYDLTRDGAGRVQTKDQQIGTASSSLSYTYDNLDRLTEVAIPGSPATSTYTYDSNGNRIGGNIGAQVTSAVYDDQDRATSYNVFNYTYTKNGDLLSKTNSLTSEVTSYIYDVFGNLKSVTLPTSSVITYDVDTLNRRIFKSVGGVIQKRWIFRDQYRIAAQLTGPGVMDKQFVYGSKKNIPDYMIYNSEKYRIISDNLGSLRLVVKVSDGTVVQKMNHDEFGRVIEDTNPGFTPFGFAGGHYDSDTGLIRFGARDYDPEIGRWTSKDPILFAGRQTNLYGYTFNDPLSFIDPTGTVGWGGAIVGGVVGGVSGYLTGISTGANPAQAALAGAAIGAASGFTGAYLLEGAAALGVGTAGQIFAGSFGAFQTGFVGSMLSQQISGQRPSVGDAAKQGGMCAVGAGGGAALGLGYSSGAQMAIDGAFGASLIPIDLLLAR